MNDKREPGYYWVKIGFGDTFKWVIAEYIQYGFWMYKGFRYADENFRGIDEERITRKS